MDSNLRNKTCADHKRPVNIENGNNHTELFVQYRKFQGKSKAQRCRGNFRTSLFNSVLKQENVISA